MNGRTLVLMLGAVGFSVLGQLFMKAGAQELPAHGRLELLVDATTNVNVLLGLVAWAASTACWLYVLQVTPLSRAYGLTSLTYVILPLASLWLFGEPLRRLHGLGSLLIVLGVACLLAGD